MSKERLMTVDAERVVAGLVRAGLLARVGSNLYSIPADQAALPAKVEGPEVYSAIERVFAAWIESTGRSRVRLDPRRRKLIRAALADYPIEDVLAAVDGWRHSAHHRGENDRATVYNDLSLLLRNGETIERFRDYSLGVLNGRGERGSTDADRREQMMSGMRESAQRQLGSG
jgi:hypothetical protein